MERGVKAQGQGKAQGQVKVKVFDPLRRKYVTLTAEEGVRQGFVSYLAGVKGYPVGMMANEVWIKVHGVKKRCDTVVYGRGLEPLMIIEYKAPGVRLDGGVFRQVAVYNIGLRVKYLTLSNGVEQYCCRVDYEGGGYEFLGEVPDYKQL
jgi:hypothetical protein